MMNVADISPEAFNSLLEVKLGVDYTDEQKELISHFGDGPTICFASPGTGKTFTAVGGLLTAELLKGIPGENIYALSFTRLATGELGVRYEKACRKLGITSCVNFATLHSLCRQIVKDNYRLLGMSSFNTSAPMSMERAYKLIDESLPELGLEPLEPRQIKACVRAVSALNSAMVFDEDAVQTKMAFKECGVRYETFDKIRGLLFACSILSETISVSDLLLYASILLRKHPEISQNFKNQCKVMLVDEAQDLSLLQLGIINMLTDNPILIGDMKQQIYAFNGACQEVTDAFYQMYPKCTTLRLTQSFRCKNEIADYATKIIQPNNLGGEDFKGVGEGGIVQIHNSLYVNGLDIETLASRLKIEYVGNLNKFEKTYLFLSRNNISLIPVIEELYRKELPFRVNKYTKAFEIPVVKDLVQLCQLAANPYSFNSVGCLKYLIPEFKDYSLKEHPFYKIMSTQTCSVFEINYQFRDIASATQGMMLLTEIEEMIKNNARVGDLFNKLWGTYKAVWGDSNNWRLENDADYYISTVQSLMNKTFNQFLQDEIKKTDIIAESERYGRGVRCYTMHASKGLEADVVYIIDADEGIIPNESKLRRMLKKECDMDAARAIREERSLCYVACTRAKSELHIIYNEKPAPMIIGCNPYEQYDEVYKYYKAVGNDIKAFESFCGRYINL